MKTIEDLSPELLVEIFSHVVESDGHIRFLRTISLVCKVWNQVLSTPSLWKTIEPGLSWEDLVALSKKGLMYHMESLVLPESEGIGQRPLDLALVIPNMRKLKNLDVSGHNLNWRNMMVIAKYGSHLERLTMKKVIYKGWGFSLSLQELVPALSVCCHKLTHLDLSSSCLSMKTEELVSYIGDKCPLLEEFGFQHLDYSVFHRFPIHKLQIGCPKLRKLEFTYCDVITMDGINDGFRCIETFKAGESDFHGLNLHSLLRNSTNLEHLELISNENLIFHDISEIPSNKLRVLEIWLHTSDFNMNIINRVAEKWKGTLSELHLRIWDCDIGSALEIILAGNPNPRIEALTMGNGTVALSLLKMFLLRCQNLKRLHIVPQTVDQRVRLFNNRSEIVTFLNLL